MIQGEAQMTKTLIDTTQRGLEAKIVEVESHAESGRATGTSANMTKPPNFDRTTSWAVFQCRFKTIRKQICWTSLEKSTYLQGMATNILHGVPKHMKKPLRPWRTALGTSTWPPHITVIQRPGIRVSVKPCKNLPPCLPCTTQEPYKEGGRQGVHLRGRRPAIKIQLLLGGEKRVN
jgi:hypothetical protein